MLSKIEVPVPLGATGSSKVIFGRTCALEPTLNKPVGGGRTKLSETATMLATLAIMGVWNLILIVSDGSSILASLQT